MNFDIRPIIAQYPADCQPTAIEYLADAGGFSGSQFWRLTTPRGPLALRRYAPGLVNLNVGSSGEFWDRLRVARLHFQVPIPIGSTTGSPLVLSDSGDFWDLCNWLPGQIVPEGSVTVNHVRSALRALAELHVTLQTLKPPPIPPAKFLPRPSSGSTGSKSYNCGVCRRLSIT